MKNKIIILFIFLLTNCNAQYSFDSTGRVFSKLYGVKLEKATINEVQRLLGDAEIYQDGDAASSSTRVNYFIKKDNLYIVFDSGEMGGGVIINSFNISLIPVKEKYTINSRVSMSRKDLQGIHLGMSKIDFFKIFPSKYIMDSSKQDYDKIGFFDIKKPDRFILFDNKIPMTKEDIKYFRIKNLKNAFFDETIWIIPTFKCDTLVELNVSKSTYS